MSEASVAGAGEARREAAAGAGLASFGMLITGVLNLLLLTVLTRTLSKADLGLFLLVFTVQDTINTLLPLGLPAALAYFVPRRGETAARALGFWTGGLLFLLSLPAAVILGFFPSLLTADPAAASIFQLLALYIVADFPGQALPAHLLARRSYRGFFLVTLLFGVSRFASVAIPAALGVPLVGIMGWFLIVAGIRLVLFLGYFLLVASGSLSAGLVKPRELLQYGLPLSLATIVGKLNVQADRYLMIAVASKEVFAVYTLGAVELPLVASLAYSVTNALVPSLTLAHATGDTGSFLRLWHGSMEKVAVIMMPVFFYFMLLADSALRVLFSTGYADAAIPFRVYLLLLPLRLCGYGAVLRALGETRAVFSSSVAGLLTNAVLIYPLYLLLGLAGPALASVIALVVAIAMLLARIKGALALSWRTVMPWRRLGRSFGVAGAAAVPLIGLLVLVPSDGLRLVAGAAMLLPVYLWLGHRAGVIAGGDLAYLGRLLSLRTLWERRSGRGGEG